MKFRKQGKQIRQDTPLFQRVASFVFSFVLLIQSLLFNTAISVSAATASDTASGVSHFIQNDVYIDIEKKLEDYDNRLYMLTVDASSYIKKEYKPYTRTYSKNGSFVAEESGYYLVELWGGAGGNGLDSASGDRGGTGGSSGYVYAYLYMDAGQSLVFTIGTNGAQRADSGANEGGIQAPGSVYAAGAGGGYSAVFFFDDARYSYSLSERERLSNYIMIAGGGGGGGAPTTALYSASYVNEPNGGMGGNLEISKSGKLTADDNNGVAGTYYIGSNGISSGTSAKYIGYGGTNVPGKMPTSWDGYVGVIRSNDWTGTYNDEWYETHPEYDDKATEPGGGGMGAMHGGSGGAGFTGGSGGFQSALLIPTNIGGGGGGSSFVADNTVKGTPLFSELTEDVKAYLNKHNPSADGGACEITFLGSSTAEGNIKTVDTSHMANVNLAGGISKYFDVVSVTASGDNGTVMSSVSSSGETSITVTGASIQPDALGFKKDTLTLKILVRAKEDFAGGNMVPIVSSQFSITPEEHDTVTADDISETDYCNVPLNFTAVARSYMSNEPGKTYQVSELYTDNYATARNNCNDSSYYQWEFLKSISPYSVKAVGSSTALTSVAPTETTSYTVSFTVTPKSTSGATVGKVINAAVFSATSTITIVTADMADTLNGLEVDATKLLSHSGSHYTFEVNVNQKSPTTFVMDNTMIFGSGTSSYAVKQDGWYYLQLWGGDGQGSGKVSVTHTVSSYDKTASGGKGGSGGYVSGFVYLSKGQIISCEIGESGGASATASKTVNMKNTLLQTKSDYSVGGAGGKHSAVLLNGSYLLIAGGGGGAGGAAAISKSNGSSAIANGKTGNTPGSIETELSASDTAYDGGKGGNGSTSSSGGYLGSIKASSGSAGAAGKNYRAEGYDYTAASEHGMSDTAFIYAESLTSTKGGKGGQLTLTLLETEETKGYISDLFGLTSSGTVSRYFDIDAIDMKTVAQAAETQRTNNADGSTTVVYTNTSGEIARFTYRLTPNTNGTTSWSAYDTSYSPATVMEPKTLDDGTSGYDMYYRSALTFSLTLSPKEGFLGGNDVPLVQYGTAGEEDTGVEISQKGESRRLNRRDSVDFANVDVRYMLSESNLDTRDAVIICGETVNQADLLTVNSIPLPSGSDAWKSEFVQAVYPTTANVAPTATTTYSFTAKVAASAEPEKAIVVDAAEAVEFTKTATVYVNYTVTDNMTHLRYDGERLIPSGEALSATVVPDSGYLLPESIAVTVGGTTLSSSKYTYNSANGELTIAAANITGNIVISGSAGVVTYHIYYTYEDADGVQHKEVEAKAFPAGSTIQASELSKYNEINASLPEKTGCTFQWDWQTDNAHPLTEMPAEDWYVYGSYQPNAYSLTIHYREKGTETSVAEDYTKAVYYGSEYTVVSPNVAGYLAERVVVSGTMEAQNTEITVEYTKNSGKLSVIYLYADSKQVAAEPYHQDIQTGDKYSVSSPAITGYTADCPVVSGTVSGTEADNGIILYVYYSPNTYTVTFNPNGGTLDDAELTKTVAYHNIYGYNPTANEGEQYATLPQPIRTGYEFLGWYDADNNLIEEESIVAVAENHTLTARWKEQSYRLTIYYTFTDSSGNVLSDGERPADAVSVFAQSYTLGENYDISLPVYQGYSCDYGADSISGTMGAGNRVYYVTYSRLRYTVTFHLTTADGRPLSKSATEQYTTVKTFNYDYGQSATLGYTTNDNSSANVSGLSYNSTGINAYTYVPRGYVQLKNIGTNSQDIYTTSDSAGNNRDQIYSIYSSSAYTNCTDNTVKSYKNYLSIHSEDITVNGLNIDINIRCAARYCYTVSYTVSDADGAGYKPTAPDKVCMPFYYYDSITVNSPEIEHWTPSSTAVSPVTTSTGNKTNSVSYTVEKHTLTVNYKYDDNIENTSLAGTVINKKSYSLPYNTSFSYESPSIEGYQASPSTVTGTMATDDIVMTVIYSDRQDIVSATIEWNNLTFDLGGLAWVPESHSYVGNSFTPVASSSNCLKVKNTGTVDLKAEFSYESVTPYRDISGYFTAENDAEATPVTAPQNVLSNKEVTAWLWLEGKAVLTEIPNSFVSGKCTVTISEGGGD